MGVISGNTVHAIQASPDIHTDV